MSTLDRTPAPVPPSDGRRERDDALLADLTAPPSLEDARESYAFWRMRAAQLPRHRRADRREAELMAARWKERVAVAERERYGTPLIDQLLDVLGIRWRPDLARMKRTVMTVAIVMVVVMILAIGATIAFWSEVMNTFSGGH